MQFTVSESMFLWKTVNYGFLETTAFLFSPVSVC